MPPRLPRASRLTLHCSYPCATGYSCAAGFQTCFPTPRKSGQPCDPAASPSECDAGLACDERYPYCSSPAAKAARALRRSVL